MSEVTVRVPGKVNLGLSVGPPADDGYHELVNVFHAVSLFDEVTARPADGMSVSVTGVDCGGVPLDADNLAVTAARTLAERSGVRDGVALSIDKSIPVAGGMAGGSADAAAALVACDRLWKTDLSREELLNIAADLGADVAFPLVGGTAVGLGRGELLTPVPTRSTFHWVFAVADGGLSAAMVYAECDRLRAEAGEAVGPPQPRGPLMSAVTGGDAAALGAQLRNDLQPAALSLRPDLRTTLDTGRQLGALAALVSGSGPTCAFLARSQEHAAELAAALDAHDAPGVCRATWQAYGPVPGARIVFPVGTE